ncbi:helix-turn-helix domain-containing protein [Mycolicibacterium sp. A43C]
MTKPDQIPYAIRKTLRHTLGVAAEAVLDVLAHHDTGAGAEITHEALAAEAGITRATTRRTIEALYEAGWIKRDTQIRGRRQIANRYRVVLGEQGAQGEQAPYLITAEVDKTYLVDNQVVLKEQRNNQKWSGADAPPSHMDLHQVVYEVADDLADTPTDLGTSEDLGRRRRPRAVRSAHLLTDNYFTRSHLIKQIVDTFEDRVVQATGRRVNKSRINAFTTTARVLLEDHRRLPDILAVIDFVADQGLLADTAGEAKITCLFQIRENFDDLLGKANTGVSPIPDMAADITTASVSLDQVVAEASSVGCQHSKLAIRYPGNPHITEARANIFQLLKNHG